MKALVTGGAGFIGSHLSEQLLDGGAEVIALDCFTDYYPRALKEANIAALRAPSRLPLRRSEHRGRGPGGAARRHDARVPPRGAGRRSQELGPRVPRSTRPSTSTRRRSCSKPASAGRSSGSSMPRARRCTATRLPSRCTRTLPLHPVSPYGVTKLAAEQLCYLYFVNHGVPTVSLRYFTVYGPRQRPDMGFHRFFSALLDDRPLVQFGDGLQTRDFTFVDRCRPGHAHRRRPRGARAASTISEVGPACPFARSSTCWAG